MDLTPYLDDFRQELAIAADAGGAEARAFALQLAGPLESAARLTLLNALCAAMGEVNRDLAPGSVVVRLRGLDPEFVVTAPPATRTRTAGAHRPDVPRPAAPAIPLCDSAPGTSGGSIRLEFDTMAAVDEAAGLFHCVAADRGELALHLPSDCSVADVRAVLDALEDAALEPTAIGVHRASLDDVFHSLVGPLQPDDGPDLGKADKDHKSSGVRRSRGTSRGKSRGRDTD